MTRILHGIRIRYFQQLHSSGISGLSIGNSESRMLQENLSDARSQFQYIVHMPLKPNQIKGHTHETSLKIIANG